MKSLNFVSFCHLIADMFQVLSELSKTLQKNDLILPMAITAMKRTVEQVENLLVRPKYNGHLSRFLSVVQDQVRQHEEEDSDSSGDDADADEVRQSVKIQVNGGFIRRVKRLYAILFEILWNKMYTFRESHWLALLGSLPRRHFTLTALRGTWSAQCK